MVRTHLGTFARVVLFGALSVGSAFLFAFVFIVVLDLRYGEPLSRTLTDSMVWGVALPVALLSGLLFWPAFYFGLRKHKLRVSIPIVLASVILEIVLVGFFVEPFLAWLGSYFVLFVVLTAGWATSIGPPPRHLCPRCRYDLRGLREPRCPECGFVFRPVRRWPATTRLG